MFLGQRWTVEPRAERSTKSREVGDRSRSGSG